MRRWQAALVVVLVFGGVASCDDGTGPVAGLLNVVLDTPNSGTDGAILLTVTGPAGLTSAEPGAGLRLFSQGLGATTRFAVTGTLTDGAILRIGVPDIRAAASYAAMVEQVAAADYQLRPTAGYSLTVAR